MKPRAAMTLVEVLVSLMIFTVVGGAMVGILLIATNLYRRGETGRSANDECIAVLSTLDQDLERLVPSSAGGWLYTKVADPSGDCVLAFTIHTDETVRIDLGGGAAQQVVDDRGVGARQIVIWWTNTQTIDNKIQRWLMRQAWSWDGTSPLQTAIYDTVRGFSTGTAVTSGTGAFAPTIITRGCIHFGTWLSFDGSNPTYPRRQNLPTSPNLMPEWETMVSPGEGVLSPKKFSAGDTYAYDSDPVTAPATTIQWPLAIRISVGLTGGGNFAPTGQVISDTGTSTSSQVRVAGLGGQISMNDGLALVRIGNEWLQCSAVRGTLLECDSTKLGQRGARRSAQSTHARGELVEVGKQFSLVRTLGR